MLAQRRRRWANITLTLGQRLVFERLLDRWREHTETTDTDKQMSSEK